MNDTPRTDAIEDDFEEARAYSGNRMAEHARQLEREISTQASYAEQLPPLAAAMRNAANHLRGIAKKNGNDEVRKVAWALEEALGKLSVPPPQTRAFGIDEGRPGGDKTVEVRGHAEGGKLIIDEMKEREPDAPLTVADVAYLAACKFHEYHGLHLAKAHDGREHSNDFIQECERKAAANLAMAHMIEVALTRSGYSKQPQTGRIEVPFGEGYELFTELRHRHPAEAAFRRLLAMRLGVTYGDDGELQCGEIDMQRNSIEEIEAAIDARSIAKLVEWIKANPDEAAKHGYAFKPIEIGQIKP